MKAGKVVLAIVAVGCVLTSSAYANLVTDLRLAGGGTTVEITSATQVVEVQFWAHIQNGTTSNSGLTKIYANFQSSGGLINGGLTDAWGPDAGSAGTGFRTGVATLGPALDFNGDGNMDIGALSTNTDSSKFYLAKAAVNVSGLDFNLATVTFTGTSWGTNTHGITVLEAGTQAKYLTSLWKEDGVNKGSSAGQWPGQGQKIILYKRAVAVVKDALGVPVDAMHPIVLDDKDPSSSVNASAEVKGTSSTGSINWWGWDFNHDGTDELTGTGNSDTLALATLTYDYAAKILSWGTGQLTNMDKGSYTAKLTVAYTGSTVTSGSQEFPLTLSPEPATVALLAMGGLVLVARRRRVA